MTDRDKPVARCRRAIAALAFGVFVAISAPASAQIDTARAQAALAAAERLVVAIRSPDQSMPRLDDASARALYQRAFDARISGPNPPTLSDLEVLDGLQRKTGDMVAAFLLRGAGIDAGEGPDALESPGVKQLASSNFVRFLPELGQAYDFRIFTGSLIAEGVKAAMPDPASAQRPAYEAAVSDIADEQARVINAVIGCASDQQIDSNWRRERLAVMSKAVPHFAAILDRKSAQVLADRALAAAIAEQDRELAAGFKEFALSLLR